MKYCRVDLIVMLFAMLLLGLAGCGGGDGPAKTPPVISALHYTPSSLTVNTPTTVNWQFDFADAGGDLVTGTYVVFDPSGAQVFSKTINLTIPAGTVSGTQFGTTSGVLFVTVGTYTVAINATDSAGTCSNTLTASFTIVP
jgi:hypothetical protein